MSAPASGRHRGHLKPAEEREGRPDREVNVSYSNPFRYSLIGAFGRALYERRRTVDGGDYYWQHRTALPWVHARIVRRDGGRRRVATEYLASLTEDGPRVVITDDDLSDGRWAGKLGANLSGDNQIRTATETAIRDLAHRDTPEREATPRATVHCGSGHLDLPVAECLPSGYLISKPFTCDEEVRDMWAAIIGITADLPKIALTLGASAAAPYVSPLGYKSHWWDLYGDSRQGKTTAQLLAAALWGDPRIGHGIVLGWNATSVGTGRHLGALGILPPFFDERGLAPFDRAKWGELVYATCQGSSKLKAESDSPSGVHRGLPWFGTLFSTGNHRLTDGLSAGRFAGIPARVIELEAPFTTDAGQAEALEEMAGDCYGWLGPAILATCTTHTVKDHLARAKELVGMPELGVPRSIAKHLHMAVTGAMMIDTLVGTETLLTDAAVTAAREYLDAHSAEPEHDADRMLAALAESLVARRSAWPTIEQWQELGDTPRVWAGSGADGDTGQAHTPRVDLPQHGFDQQQFGVQDDTWLYVMPSTWQRIAEELGVDSSVACARLAQRGQLHVPPSRRRRGEWQATSPRAIGARTRVYQVALSALADSDPADEPCPPTTPDTPTPPTPSVDDYTPAASPSETDQRPEDAPPGDSPAGSTETRTEPLSAPQDNPPDAGDGDGQDGPVYTPRRALRAMPLAEARSTMLRESTAAIDAGHGLRALDALAGPYIPMRKVDGRLQRAEMRPAIPGITGLVTPVAGWQWPRRGPRAYDGPTVTLDRSGAFLSAAATVPVGHGALEHTGPCEYRKRPGYYLIDRFPWAKDDVLPHPLGTHLARSPDEQMWVTAPHVDLLIELAAAGWWPDVTIVDSYTAEPARMEKWAKEYVNTIRAHTITTYNRDSDEYRRVKDGFSQAINMTRGTNGKPSEKSQLFRPDWTNAIMTHAAVTLWRRAWQCLDMTGPELGPVRLQNTDELVLPAEALPIVTGEAHPRLGRPPIVLDPSGTTLGSFKVKTEATA